MIGSRTKQRVWRARDGQARPTGAHDRPEPGSPTEAHGAAGPHGEALFAERLAVGYGDKQVLTGVEFALRPGEVSVFVGPNGCGKSTLLRTAAGLQPALDGSMRVHGRALDSLSRRALSRRLAFLGQTVQIPAGVTVRELVRHGRFAHRGSLARHSAEDAAAIAWAMAVTEAELLGRKRLDELSGGERQRAWLATVLAQRAGILLLDEPTTYLDLRHQFEVLDVVRNLADEHAIACGVVLHDLTHAAAYADTVVLLAGGTIMRAGTPSEVLNSAAISEAFGVDVHVVRDPDSGHLACFPRRATAVPAQ